MSLCRMQAIYAYSSGMADEPVGKDRWFEPKDTSKGTDVFFGYDFYGAKQHGGGNDGQWLWVWHTSKPFQYWWASKPQLWVRMGSVYWYNEGDDITIVRHLVGDAGIRTRKRWANRRRRNAAREAARRSRL